MKEVNVSTVMYEAFDGQQFKTQCECLKHEGEAISDKILSIPHKLVCHEDVFPTGSEMDYLLIFSIENEEHAKSLIALDSYICGSSSPLDAPAVMVGRKYICTDVVIEAPWDKREEYLKIECMYAPIITFEEFIGMHTKYLVESCRFEVSR